MCDDCNEKEDEYLLEISKNGEILATKRLCEECFQIAINEED